MNKKFIRYDDYIQFGYNRHYKRYKKCLIIRGFVYDSSTTNCCYNNENKAHKSDTSGHDSTTREFAY